MNSLLEFFFTFVSIAWAADVTMVMFSQLTVIHHHHRELEKPPLSPAETARCPIHFAL